MFQTGGMGHQPGKEMLESILLSLTLNTKMIKSILEISYSTYCLSGLRPGIGKKKKRLAASTGEIALDPLLETNAVSLPCAEKAFFPHN